MLELAFVIAVSVVIAIIIFNQSAIDYNKERVLPMTDRDGAVQLLDVMNSNNKRLIEYLVSKYPPGTTGGDIGRRLQQRYNPDGIRENDPPDSNSTSFTEDKGRVLALCLRDPATKKKKFHDPNLISFVDLHELAHIGSVAWGHGDEFWSNFKFLLEHARHIDIYSPVDYSTQPVNYCGLDVTYNPLFDSSL